MAGNDSPRLVWILIRLAQSWAISKNRYERSQTRQRRGGTSAEPDDKEGEALWAAYQDHPFPGFVRFVSHRTGCDQDAIRQAALKEFNGEPELVTALNALDENGVTTELFEKARGECPDIVQRLFGTKAEASTSSGWTDAGFIERLLAGPVQVELTRSEFALLDAYLQQPISFAAIQQEKQATGDSETSANRNKLKLIRDFNRNLQAAAGVPAQSTELQPSADPAADRATKTNGAPALNTATGFLGGAALADALGVHATRRKAFFRQLERQRMSLGDDCWHEVREPRPNSPRFLYRADSPKLLDLAADYRNPKLA